MNGGLNTNPAKAYLEGMLWAAYGSRLIGGKVAEWQIDTAKECASLLKEAEIEHSMFSNAEKEEMKRQWKQCLETYTQGFKEELRREGRMV